MKTRCERFEVYIPPSIARPSALAVVERYLCIASSSSSIQYLILVSAPCWCPKPSLSIPMRQLSSDQRGTLP